MDNKNKNTAKVKFEQKGEPKLPPEGERTLHDLIMYKM